MNKAILSLLCLLLFCSDINAQKRDSIDATKPLPDTPSVKTTGSPIVDSVVKRIVTPIRPKGLSWKPVVIPVAMITYGALATNNGWLKQVNEEAREEFFLNRSNQKPFHLDNYTIYVPAVAVFGLKIAGVKSKHNFVDCGFLYAMSNAIANGVVFATKGLAGVSRPDSSDKYSFPSGHTAAAFVSAEFLRQEYKDVSPWIGAAGYVVAAGTGFLRIYNNKHWFNDVIAGAGIGILSTRLSYYFYPKLKNLIIRKADKDAAFMPVFDGQSIGFVYVKRF